MNSTLRVLNVILFILSILMVFGLGYQTGKKYDIAVDEDDKYVAISYSVNEQKMRRLMSLIDNHYVNEINTDSLVDKTIGYVMSNLDPHSVYLDKTVTQDMDNEMRGYYMGIGIQYVIYRDSMVITHVDKNSPNKDLFRLSDRVLSIDDSLLIGKAADTASDWIKSKPNSVLNFEILRDGEVQNIQAKNGMIPKATVTESYMLSGNLGYIKLNRFGENSYAEFKNALIDLQTQGMEALVFDLRGNPGGMMKAAEDIADEFLGKNKLIVFTQDKEGKKEFRYATAKGDFDEKPVYILIDEGSASASEIIAGAIQDNDAGVIIGRRSYGKGLVQREISLGDGTKLRLTTAKYFTPSGRSIQKTYSDGIEAYNKDISDRYLGGEMFSKDSIKVPDSLVFKTTKGRVVYGGGGIIPDAFVPIDSVGYGRWYYEHAHQNIFNTKIFNFIEENKESFQKLHEEHYIAFYNPKPLSKDLLREINLKTSQFSEKEMHNFNTFVKATLASFLYGEAAYDKIWNTNDPMINKAIELNQNRIK